VGNKTFLITMIEAYPCHLRMVDHLGNGFCHGNGLCEGNLNDRPAWCPLILLEVRRFDEEILYAEVEK